MALSAVLLYATLLACAVLVGWLVVHYDLHEREPLPMLVLATALGAGTMMLAGAVQVAIITVAGERGHHFSNLQAAAFAGTSEELAKFAVVAILAFAARRFFNEPIDGLIYGSFAGLGAALDESVAVLRSAMPLAALPAQEPVRLAGHLVMGGIGGFGVGLLVLRSKRAPMCIAICLLGAVLLHTLWDAVAFDAADRYEITGRVGPWHSGGAIALMLGGMVVYKNLVIAGVRMDQRTRMKDEG